MPSHDAVLFDLDSTLCVSEQTDHEIHRAVFDRVDVGPFFTPADVRDVDPDDVTTADSDRGYYEALYRAVAADVGGDPSHVPELAEATVEVVDETAVRFREGAKAALDHAREYHAVGLVTNGGEETQRAKLERLGVADEFAAVVCSGPGTGYPSKPDPEPFRALLDGLDVPADASVYVGDRLDGDVTGAHSAGMASVWVSTGDASTDPEPEPTRRLDSMGELPSVL